MPGAEPCGPNKVRLIRVDKSLFPGVDGANRGKTTEIVISDRVNRFFRYVENDVCASATISSRRHSISATGVTNRRQMTRCTRCMQVNGRYEGTARAGSLAFNLDRSGGYEFGKWLSFWWHGSGSFESSLFTTIFSEASTGILEVRLCERRKEVLARTSVPVVRACASLMERGLLPAAGGRITVAPWSGGGISAVPRLLGPHLNPLLAWVSQ